MRITFLIFILLVTSCSRGIYYAYEKDGTYATLELTKMNDIIYRTNAKEEIKKYLYIKTQNIKNYNDDVLTIGEAFLILYTDLNKEDYEVCFSKHTEKLLWNSYINYTKINVDSLILSKVDEDQLLKEPCFKETGIRWFPPYLKRIKKIDYKKFKLPYKKKYLKTMNPKHR